MPDWKAYLDSLLAEEQLDAARVTEVREEIAQHLDDRYCALLSEGLNRASRPGQFDACAAGRSTGPHGGSARRISESPGARSCAWFGHRRPSTTLGAGFQRRVQAMVVIPRLRSG